MPTCAAGHDSATADYCDTCGTPMGTASSPSAAPASAQRCDNCGAPRVGRFCEECGHDDAVAVPARAPGSTAQPVVAPQSVPTPAPDPTSQPVAAPPSDRPPTWTALVRADRAWFDEVRRRDGPDAAGLEFPRYCPERQFVLSGAQVAIGRRSRSRGTNPEIDLSGPPLDPGVSAQHALLLARPNGGWELVDLDSTNGTSLGDAPTPIAPHIPVALADGDRIKLGAWTTITITTAAPG